MQVARNFEVKNGVYMGINESFANRFGLYQDAPTMGFCEKKFGACVNE
jgi:hypothetical protein